MSADPEIVAYAKASAVKGLSRDRIKTILQVAGWGEAECEAALEEVFSSAEELAKAEKSAARSQSNQVFIPSPGDRKKGGGGAAFLIFLILIIGGVAYGHFYQREMFFQIIGMVQSWVQGLMGK